MKRDTTKRSGAKTVISKEWKPTDGINALPAVIRARVLEAVTKFRRGEPPEDNFFSKKLDTETKMSIASELIIEHIAMGDIARLLGVTRRGLEYMLERIRERNANLLPVTWNRDRLVETVNALENAGYSCLSQAEGEIDSKNKASYYATAVRAYSAAGKLRIKLGVSKGLLDLPRKRQAADIEDGAPDPKDRIDYIDWVYQNKIAPKLEEPQDAEVVQVALPAIPEGQSEGMAWFLANTSAILFAPVQGRRSDRSSTGENQNAHNNGGGKGRVAGIKK